jgi:hypothetical protein
LVSFLFSAFSGNSVRGDFADQARNEEFTNVVDNYAVTITKVLYKAGISPEIDDGSMKDTVKTLLDIAFSFKL